MTVKGLSDTLPSRYRSFDIVGGKRTSRPRDERVSTGQGLRQTCCPRTTPGSRRHGWVGEDNVGRGVHGSFVVHEIKCRRWTAERRYLKDVADGRVRLGGPVRGGFRCEPPPLRGTQGWWTAGGFGEPVSPLPSLTSVEGPSGEGLAFGSGGRLSF